MGGLREDFGDCGGAREILGVRGGPREVLKACGGVPGSHQGVLWGPHGGPREVLRIWGFQGGLWGAMEIQLGQGGVH